MEYCSERWLLARLYESDLAIVDCRPQSAYDASRIPGAISVDRLVGSDIEAQLGRAGIDEQTRIVFYGNALFDLDNSIFNEIEEYGHKQLFVLTNGFLGWEIAKFPIQTEPPISRIPTFYKNI